jgi:hypothetical protein
VFGFAGRNVALETKEMQSYSDKILNIWSYFSKLTHMHNTASSLIIVITVIITVIIIFVSELTTTMMTTRKKIRSKIHENNL